MSFSKSPEFQFYFQEKQFILNNYKQANSPNYRRLSQIEMQGMSDTNKEVFQTWQMFKEQVRKTIKDAIKKICTIRVNPNSYGCISPEILKNFWPVNKIGGNEPSKSEDASAFIETELSEANFVNQRVLDLKKYINQKNEKANIRGTGISKKTTLRSISKKTTRFRNVSKASGYSAILTRSQYDNNNPFIRTAKIDKQRGRDNVEQMNKMNAFFGGNMNQKQPLFDKECEQSLLYRQLIDEDKLENQNIQDFFKIGQENILQHLLLLFMAHIDDLLTLMGPQRSIEFVLPLYFTILNLNSIYHCNFKKINLEKKPVGIGMSFNFQKILRQKAKRASKRFKKKKEKSRVEIDPNGKSKRQTEEEKIFQNSITIKTLRKGILSNIKGIHAQSNLKKRSQKQTLHNTSIGFYLDLDNYPSLENKISSRFTSFFSKYKDKILFQDQEIYKVCLSKLIKVLRILLKFTCSGIINNQHLNRFEEKCQLNRLDTDISAFNVKTRRASLKGSQENHKSPDFVIESNGEESSQNAGVKLYQKGPDAIARENLNTPKKKKYSGGFVTQNKGGKGTFLDSEERDHSSLKLYEEFTYILQPFLSFVHSMHRVVFFLDYSDKCILYKNTFCGIDGFLKEFFFVSDLQKQLYDLKKLLHEMEHSDANSELPPDAAPGTRTKSNTNELMGTYHNEGIKMIPSEVLKKKTNRDLNIRLEYLTQFPYLLTLMTDLEEMFREIKDFYLGLTKENFFEKIGIVSETKIKNKKRLHRLLITHHNSLLVLKASIAQNFLSFSGHLNNKQKSFLLDLMDRFYLSNSVSVPIKKKNPLNDPSIDLENKTLEFSQMNNLEIKMSVVRNMHLFLGGPISSNLREKFAAYYTHIESESKDNWRIRFSILTSLMGRVVANRQKFWKFLRTRK